MNNQLVVCPSCKELSTVHLGKLKQINGRIPLSEPGNLFQCKTCGLLFRNPYIPTRELEQIYSNLSSQNWDNEYSRPDFDLCRQTIDRYIISGNILDVGCFRGDFLHSLSNDYQKFGIEPSESASFIARQRGVKIIEKYINNIEIIDPMFDCITLIDVFEHLIDPLTSLKKVKELLLPNGIILITTGNTDALSWRLLRTDYWYYYPEHVTFLNPAWFKWAAGKLGLKIISIKKFSRFPEPFYEKYHQLIAGMFYQGLQVSSKYPWFYDLITSIYPFNRVKSWPSAPSTHCWSDHIMVVLKSEI